jgi:hypothetical protein
MNTMLVRYMEVLDFEGMSESYEIAVPRTVWELSCHDRTN